MNKKLIALAVASVVAAPLAAQADVTIYGVANVSYDAVKIDKNVGGSGDRQYKVVSNSPIAGAPRSSRLGFKGSEDLGGGLKAIWKMEFSLDMANNSDVRSSRNAYVGLSGDSWGTALMGRHDTPYKMATGKYDYFADQLGDFNGTIGFQDLRAQNAVAYVSPNWGGFNLAAALVAPGTDDIADAWSIAGMYGIGGFNVSLAYEAFDKDQLIGDPQFPTWMTGGGGIAKDKWTIGGSYDFGAFGLAGRYEKQNDKYNGSTNIGDADLWQISGKYGFGNNVVKAFYGQNDTDANTNGKVDAYGIGFDHNFTKRTQAYVQWDKVDDTWDGFSLGMVHKF